MAKKKVTEKLSDEEEAKRCHREKAREFRLRIKSLSKEEREEPGHQKKGSQEEGEGEAGAIVSTTTTNWPCHTFFGNNIEAFLFDHNPNTL